MRKELFVSNNAHFNVKHLPNYTRANKHRMSHIENIMLYYGIIKHKYSPLCSRGSKFERIKT